MVIAVLTKIIKSMRPEQWSKNLIIFLALIFSQNLFSYLAVIKTTFAFIIFCLLSGSVYIINDICDFEDDKSYSWMPRRPISREELKISQALIASILIAILSLTGAFLLNLNFGFIAFMYFLLMINYSLYLKKMFLINILLVAVGFLLRAVAGGAIIDIKISYFLLIFTFFIALFLAGCKQRYKLISYGAKAKGNLTRSQTNKIMVLDQIIIMVASVAVLSYVIYTITYTPAVRLRTTNLIYTTFFVLYGILRYLYLIYHKNLISIPEQILYKDLPLLICVFIWAITVMIILYVPILL